MTVLLGVLVLGERLRPLQWCAIGIAAVAVVVLTVDYGHPPWIALLLAGSFGTYGLAKKKANVEAVESLTFETMLLAPLALAYLLWLSAHGDGRLRRPRRRPCADADHDRTGHRAPADLLRRRRDPDPDDHARAAAVPRPHASSSSSAWWSSTRR